MQSCEISTICQVIFWKVLSITGYTKLSMLLLQMKKSTHSFKPYLQAADADSESVLIIPIHHKKKKDSSLEGEWHYRIAGHKYMKNVEVIKDKLIAIHNRREFLYSNVFLCSVPSSALEKMFFKWSVDVRYETNTSSTPSAVNYNEVDVLAFFELAKEAYRVLPSRL